MRLDSLLSHSLLSGPLHLHARWFEIPDVSWFYHREISVLLTQQYIEVFFKRKRGVMGASFFLHVESKNAIFTSLVMSMDEHFHVFV